MATGAVNDIGTRSEPARRAVDVAVSAVLLLLVLPVILLTATASALVLRAWPFFAQERIGRGGTTFRFVKVRTLPPDMPAYTDKHQLEVQRIPALCRLFRRLHLDELPQLFLVLRGQMSLIGPRPEMAYLHEQFPTAFADLRTSIRPGCTGLWQVSESCDGLIGASPEYDRFYVDNRSWRLDLWIAYRTVLKMTGLGRTIALDEVPGWAGAQHGTADVIDLRDAIDAEPTALTIAAGP
jgi:lipopolysaccharide/colanic/teichoic acid biosynthesis glycosyltransferase